MIKKVIPTITKQLYLIPLKSCSQTEGFILTLPNHPGKLRKALEIFSKYEVNITSIESQLMNRDVNGFQKALISIELESSQTTDPAIKEIASFALLEKKNSIPVVPWFPAKLGDLDDMGGILQERNDEGGENHPAFKDLNYQKRRNQIAEISRNTKISEPIPILNYTPTEEATWRTIFNKIVPMHKEIMCSQYLACWEKLRKKCSLSDEHIPQLRVINEYLQAETDFRIKITHGILSQREFLNALAFRVFCCTQYIRHDQNPFYTPEPDIVHEVIGHIPMFLDEKFCEISQTLGLLSLGASEEDLVKIGALYWYTVEFGACREGSQIRGFGAGIASSIAEMQHFVSEHPRFENLDPFENLKLNFPVQTVQPIYMVANSFSDALFKLIEFGSYLKRPFKAWYDFQDKSVKTDRRVTKKKIEEKSLLF